MKDNKLLLIVMAVLLVLSIVTTGVLVFKDSGTTVTTAESQNSLYVTSEGSVTVIPDVGYITLGVDTSNADVKIAEDENSATMNAIVEALKKLKIDEQDIKTTSYYIYPQYDDYTDEKPQTYMVSTSVEVTVKNIEDIGDVIDAAVEAGANRSNSIYFDVLDREASYNEALQDAIANAKAKAELLADAAGLKIVGIMYLSEDYSSSYYYSGARYAMDSMEESYASISTGDMEITANVSITFEVKNK